MKSTELKVAIETISIANNIEKQVVSDILIETIKEKLVEYVNVFEEDIDIIIDANFNFCLSLKNEALEFFKRIFSKEMQEVKEENSLEKVVISKELSYIIIDKVLKRGAIRDFNRNLKYRLNNIKSDVLYKEYKAKEGSVISGTFLREKGKAMVIGLESKSGITEGEIHYREQMPNEKFKQREHIKCFVKEVKLDNRNRLFIELSRKDPRLITKLFEKEVEEIATGIVKIKGIVRDAGKKTKIAVYSIKSEVEPVGACVGLHGNRIKSLITELKGERIDVIPFSKDIHTFISKALSPGKVVKILPIDERENKVLVVVEDETYALAIGKAGVNIKLASKLTGWDINVRTESQINKHPEVLKIFSQIDQLFVNDDTDLSQLTGIDEEILVKFMNAGIMTISELYDKTVEEISKIEGVGKENANKIREILDEIVEVVETEDELQKGRQDYLSEVEDKIEGVDTEEKLEEEILQIEYLICPSCEFEFEFKEQNACPSCNAEFEFE